MRTIENSDGDGYQYDLTQHPDMKRDGVGFFVPLRSKENKIQSGLGIHPDGGTPGTHGCAGVAADGGKLEKFGKAIDQYQGKHGKMDVNVRTENKAKTQNQTSHKPMKSDPYTGGNHISDAARTENNTAPQTNSIDLSNDDGGGIGAMVHRIGWSGW